MNILLAREGAEEHAGTKSYFYCNKVFNNYRALGVHLRIHQGGRILRPLNYPGCSGNSVNITGNLPASPLNDQPNSFAGFNGLTLSTTAPLAFDFSRMFYLNEMNQICQVGLPPSFEDALSNVQAYYNLGPSSSGPDIVGRYDGTSLGKRPYVADISGKAEIPNAPKQPRIAHNEHAEPEKPPTKELPLFMDVDKPISASETYCSSEEEDPVYMDWSLHP